MAEQKRTKITDTLSHIDGKMKLVVGIITNVGIIVGAVVAAVNWAISPITSQLNALEQSTTRSELLTLMANYPEDRRAISELAYHYFAELKGDSYVYSVYADWAKTHDVDYSQITQLHNLNK